VTIYNYIELIEGYKITSSAYNLIVDRIFFGKSLIKHRNSGGARTVPCGTLDVTSVTSLCSPLTNTCCRLPVTMSCYVLGFFKGPLAGFTLKGFRF